ncbi:hypothetical protein SAMD00019534_089970 [Acytostelium subglobosum LB1]|uniref:hypothetical protein n=1 Tax=Acytostelium subglobosum LB1 TaxID=1410327 RepID=UPI000644F345|nr:hypothetical protein SAMD00019534_089970 [Acytostelium subglobosum LB1]GAM25822.1 hypothetical protein SAMD00019534_089970 [Acytostelium subglobosum LB1]|eukprot:XP_012751340.1 hypothetical protein SAMD00019534_089970 [Acytostelium subglobosum LB1]
MAIFKIVKADGAERKVSGYQYVPPPPGTKQFVSTKLGSAALPPSVDLRPHMTTVENQEATSSCVANAVAGAYEYLVKRYHNNDSYDVSRLFIYYNARELAGETEIKDEGTFIRHAIEGLKQYGAPSETTWPFDVKRVNDVPDQKSYDEAALFLIEENELVPTELDAWKKCLAEGNPIIFAMRLYNSFDSHRKAGLVPIPSPAEESRGSHGAHAMLCVGYNDKDQVFIIRNSWGSTWGDKGYCYIPYRYLIDAKHNHGDSWIIKRLEVLELDEEAWGDNVSIMEHVENELSNMSDEEYAEFMDAMGDSPFEYRLARLFLHAASADNELTDAELDGITDYLQQVLDNLCIKMGAGRLLNRCLRDFQRESDADVEAFLQETIDLFANNLSKPTLGGLLAKLEEVVSGDDLAAEEADFIDMLVEQWQIDA